MPSEIKTYAGIEFEVHIPAEPDATYKKMLIIRTPHFSEHAILALIAEEFKGIDTGQVRYEINPHRGLVIKK